MANIFIHFNVSMLSVIIYCGFFLFYRGLKKKKMKLCKVEYFVAALVCLKKQN